MKEQQSGLGPTTHRHYPRRQTAYEAETETYEAEEADPSYGGHFAGLHPEHRPSQSGPVTPLSTGSRANTPTTSVPVEAEDESELEEDASYYTTRLPTSARRYQVSPQPVSQPVYQQVYQQGNRRYHVGYVDIPRRASRQAQLPPPRQSQLYRDEEAIPALPARRSKRRHHPLVYLGVGMLAMAALFFLLSSALTWVGQKQDDLVYGRPRTFQLDAVVGHHDSPQRPSHFIALNLHRHVEVIELPGGDVTAMRVYAITTLFGDGGEFTPVTMSVRDVTGDGKPDLLVHLQQTVIVLVNDHGTFRAARPGEVKGIL